MAKLFHFPLCPFSRRIRLALGEYGLEAELIEERSWERRREFLKLNPAGKTPVWIEEDGSIVAGIEAVGEFLEEVSSARGAQKSLLPGDATARAEARRLVAWFDVKFNEEVTSNLVEEKVDRKFAAKEAGGDGRANMAAVRAGLQNIRYHLDYIAHLTGKRSWLAGDDISMADLAAAAHISCLDYLGDVPWSSNEAAKIWYQRVKSRPSFRPLLADLIPGLPPPRIYADLDF